MTILSIVNAAIASLPDHSWEIQVLWGCQEEPNGDGGLHARDVTQILNKNPAARLVKSVMRLSNPTLFCIVFGGQQADGTSGAQTAMGGGHSNLHPNDILPPPAEDIIDDIGEDLDDDAEMRHLNQRNLRTTKSGFQKFISKLQQWIIRQQQYLQVIQNCAFGLFANY